MHNRIALPRYIAICGNPKSGKSLLQEILLRNYCVQPVDDGFVLRDTAMRHFGATHDQVHTQEGKASLAYWPNGDPILNEETGAHMLWRQVLGELGKKLELLLGEFVMPMTACSRLTGPGPFSFGSVRKTQGHYFKKHGGVIIELDNPLALPTGNDFDVYDRSILDYTIYNDALARGLSPASARKDLEEKLHTVLLDIHFAALRKAA
jgi:hypothetical protein